MSGTKLNRNGWLARTIKMSGIQKSPISARAFEILHIYWRGLEPNEKTPDRAINSVLQPVVSGFRRKETADPPCDKQKLLLGSIAHSWGVGVDTTSLRLCETLFPHIELNRQGLFHEFMLSFFRK